MSLLLVALIGLLSGLLVLIAAPLVSSNLLDDDRVVQWYHSMAMRCRGATGILMREGDGRNVSLESITMEHGMWTTSVDGETRHFADPDSKTGRSYGVPFAILDEQTGQVIEPADAELGEILKRKNERDELIRTHGDRPAFESLAAVPTDDHRLVELADARHCVTSSETAALFDRVKEFTKFGQSMFGDRSTTELVAILGSVAAGAGTVIIMLELLGGGSGGGGPPGTELVSGVVLPAAVGETVVMLL